MCDDDVVMKLANQTAAASASIPSSKQTEANQGGR